MANEKAKMKTLTLEDTTFEIVDEHARTLLGNTSVSEQITAATKELVTNDQLITVTETMTELKEKVTESTDNVVQLEQDLKTYVDEKIKTVESGNIDDGEI